MAFALHETHKERQKAAYESAAALLHRGENRLSLVLASLASILLSFVSYFVSWAGALALYELPFLQGVEKYDFFIWLGTHLLTLALFVLLAMPFWLGTYRMAIRMVDGASFGVEDVFYFVRGRRAYARAVGLSLSLLGYWLPAFFGFLLVSGFFDGAWLGFLLVFVFVITLLLSMLLVSKLGGFVTLALTDESLSIGKAKRLMVSFMVRRRMCAFRFSLATAWWILLSLIPVGVPFLLHTLPMSMLSAVCYSRRMAAQNDNND